MIFCLKISRKKNIYIFFLHNMACLEVVYPIEHEYVDLNIKFQLIIYNTNPVILFKENTSFWTHQAMSPGSPRKFFFHL